MAAWRHLSKGVRNGPVGATRADKLIKRVVFVIGHHPIDRHPVAVAGGTIV